MRQHSPLLFSPLAALFVFSALLVSCTPFGHLTRIPPESADGPQAAQCGACHVEQYREWQGSTHARSTSNTSFQEAAGNPPAAECLECHSPLGIPAGHRRSRPFHQQEGVTCVSCHLDQGKMHGPHAASALLTPHPIEENTALYRNPAFCGSCHEETLSQWRQAAAKEKPRTCQECHQEEVQRPATQGTNFLSTALVSFEDRHATRSHAITLDTMANFPDGVTISAMAQSTGTGAPALAVTIRNNLPHDLPTGTFGAKRILLTLTFEKEGSQGETMEVPVSDAQQALPAGESRKIVIPLSPDAVAATTLHLDLLRRSVPPEQRPPILLSTLVLDSIAEAFH